MVGEKWCFREGRRLHDVGGEKIIVFYFDGGVGNYDEYEI